MTLIVLTVVVIALLIAILAIFLFAIGVLLNRTADNLDDCAQNVKNIAYQAEAIGPGVKRINETGTTVLTGFHPSPTRHVVVGLVVGGSGRAV
jgi:HAMP domain-containing protein